VSSIASDNDECVASQYWCSYYGLLGLISHCCHVLLFFLLLFFFLCHACCRSTLLQTLAGHCPLTVHGMVGSYEVAMNNDDDVENASSTDDTAPTTVTIRPVVPTQVAWLQQHDDFFTQLTVEETLQLSAFLELPPEAGLVERQTRVDRTLTQLGLWHVRHRRIGAAASESAAANNGGGTAVASPWGAFGRRRKKLFPKRKRQRRAASGGRLSGGERRRLSVALELLTQKQLIIADEPTTGLDSSYSVTVMKLLKNLGKLSNIPVISSLHQPRSSIWRNLDAVILMAPGGRVCYAGDRDQAIAYFANHLGYTMPDNTNPAEFLIDLISISSEDAEQAEADEARIDAMAKAFLEYQQKQWKTMKNSGWRQHHHKKSVKVQFEAADDRSSSTLLQQIHRHGGWRSLWRWIPRVGALWLRSWRQNYRNTNLNLVRLGVSLGNAVLLAGIFPSVSSAGGPPMVNSIADRCALLSFAAINLMMISYMKTVTLFAQEKPVLHREQTREQYPPHEYLIAKVLAEIPLDVAFSAVFTAGLKLCSGLLISWKQSMAVFSLLTMAGASLGFSLGSFAPTSHYATTAGIPVLVILMVVGIINPSGVDPSRPPPRLVRWMKVCSPFAYAIEALCVAEYKGVQFQHARGFLGRLKGATRIGGLAMIDVSDWLRGCTHARSDGFFRCSTYCISYALVQSNVCGLSRTQSGDIVLEALGLKSQTFAGAMKHLAIITAGNLLLSWCGLLFQQRKNRRKPKRSRKLGKQLAPTERTEKKVSPLDYNHSPKRMPARVRL